MESKMADNLRTRAKLGLSLTKEERAFFILFVANDKEVAEFLAREK